jgi:hypothetical protein
MHTESNGLLLCKTHVVLADDFIAEFRVELPCGVVFTLDDQVKLVAAPIDDEFLARRDKLRPEALAPPRLR